MATNQQPETNTRSESTSNKRGNKPRMRSVTTQEGRVFPPAMQISQDFRRATFDFNQVFAWLTRTLTC